MLIVEIVWPPESESCHDQAENCIEGDIIPDRDGYDPSS